MQYFFIEGTDLGVTKVKETLLNKQSVSWKQIAQILVNHENFPNSGDCLHILSEFAFKQIPKNPAQQFFGKLLLTMEVENLETILKIATNNPSLSTTLSRLQSCSDEYLKSLDIFFEQRGGEYCGILRANNM